MPSLTAGGPAGVASVSSMVKLRLLSTPPAAAAARDTNEVSFGTSGEAFRRGAAELRVPLNESLREDLFMPANEHYNVILLPKGVVNNLPSSPT